MWLGEKAVFVACLSFQRREDLTVQGRIAWQDFHRRDPLIALRDPERVAVVDLGTALVA